ncbi:hypothetical protein HGP14_30680 [Rhizobium sp. P32RR-XVIII]|uniref:helix-turn-helix domain-containing protein n=1 Tax=Rhizobium sp. P32RR-XVIII TaxID=2726738 RepID=UPI001456E626|nr:helix-turn-helix domain-containing protein [Rhizobium sp. P32RR-XVIII]NLS07632.1 hypothetical protein [Rhizobium sp. P32RR-XVIII]
MTHPIKHPPAIVLLPRDFEAKTADLSTDERAERRKKYLDEYFATRRQLISWIDRDKDSRMSGKYTKRIARYAIECTNFDTGQCNPSYQRIADEIGCSVRTVEREMPKIEAAGWCRSIRVSRTMSKFYLWTAPQHKVKFLDEEATAKAEARERARAERKRKIREKFEPTDVSGRPQFEPTDVSGHEPTTVSGREPTTVSGKHINEHRNGNTQSTAFSDGRGGTYTHAHARETIPTDEALFGPWIKANIPDPNKRREALKLLREHRMTPDALRRLAA